MHSRGDIVFRAAFFDLDDTLIDAAPAFEAGRKAAFAEAARRLPAVGEEDLLAVWFPVQQELFHALDAGDMTMAQVRDARFQWMLERLGVQDGALAERLNAILGQRQLEALRLFGDVVILDELRARGLFVGIITNGAGDAADDSQRTKAAHLGLLDKVDGFWVSDEIGYRKPSIHAYLPALQAVGAPASDCLYIGDGLATDILGANAASMRSVLIARDGKDSATIVQAEPWRVIQSLWQLRDLLVEEDVASSIPME
jgi:putative hydrolase of the HAD superfamily